MLIKYFKMPEEPPEAGTSLCGVLEMNHPDPATYRMQCEYGLNLNFNFVVEMNPAL